VKNAIFMLERSGIDNSGSSRVEWAHSTLGTTKFPSRLIDFFYFSHKDVDMPKRSSNTTPASLPPMNEEDLKRAAAALLGRLGGLKGGKARAEKLSGRRRKAIARKAALTRWEARKKK
jgi:hypothetical protein